MSLQVSSVILYSCWDAPCKLTDDVTAGLVLQPESLESDLRGAPHQAGPRLARHPPPPPVAPTVLPPVSLCCARSFPGKGRLGSGQTLLHGGRRRGWGVSLCSALSRPAWGAQVLGTYPPTPPDPLFGHFLGVCCSVSPCATLLVSNHVATTWPTAPRPPCHHSPLGAPCILLLLRLPCRKRAPGQPRTQRRGFPILVVLPRAVQEEPQEDFILSERVTSHPSAARWH